MIHEFKSVKIETMEYNDLYNLNVHVCDQEEVFGAGTWAEKCEILAEACQEKFEFMNFMHFFMCDIE